MTGMTHIYDTRVYYDHTDAQGYVYYANYLIMAERARTTMLLDADVSNSSLKEKYGGVFVVRRALVEYRAPAKLEDLLQIQTRVLEVKKASVKVHHEVTRSDQLLVSMEVLLAFISEKGKPLPIPASLAKVLAGE